MKIIGITGGIGSGKSTASSVLRDLGAEVIDADLLSHEATQTDKPAYRQIIREFGSSVVNSDQSLNREKLAGIVFQRPDLKQRLEDIIHTEVVEAMLNRIQTLKKDGYDGLVVLDVPIPVKHGFLDAADTVWVVTADEETRIKRVVKRSGISLADAKNRIRSQMSQEEYMRLGDEIIANDGTPEELRASIVALLDRQS